MGAWAYCQGTDCDQPIQRDDYSMEDVMNETYECPTCGYINYVVGYSAAEAMQNMFGGLSLDLAKTGTGALQQYQNVMGVLSGFDRMRFQGTLRSISYGEGLDRFLGAAGVRYKDLGTFAQGLSDQLKHHAEQLAMAAGRDRL